MLADSYVCTSSREHTRKYARTDETSTCRKHFPCKFSCNLHQILGLTHCGGCEISEQSRKQRVNKQRVNSMETSQKCQYLIEETRFEQLEPQIQTRCVKLKDNADKAPIDFQSLLNEFKSDLLTPFHHCACMHSIG